MDKVGWRLTKLLPCNVYMSLVSPDVVMFQVKRFSISLIKEKNRSLRIS